MSRLETISARLWELRKEKEKREHRTVSQKEVAEAIGVSQASIANWERGLNGMGLDDAWKLADYYGVSIGELVGRTECEKRESQTCA